MKRKPPGKSDYHATWGDIKADFSAEQLQAIGAVAMNYNEMEFFIDTIFLVATNIPDSLSLEVSTRINGIEGKLEIIKQAIKQYDLDPADVTQINVVLGDEGFMLLKRYRDAVVHARAFNVPMGIGVKIDRRASMYEVLLTTSALNALYDRITATRHELHDAFSLIAIARAIKRFAADDPRTRSLAGAKSSYTAQFREHLSRRRSLPPLPAFPSELELKESRDEWNRARQAEAAAEAQRWHREQLQKKGS